MPLPFQPRLCIDLDRRQPRWPGTHTPGRSMRPASGVRKHVLACSGASASTFQPSTSTQSMYLQLCNLSVTTYVIFWFSSCDWGEEYRITRRSNCRAEKLHHEPELAVEHVDAEMDGVAAFSAAISSGVMSGFITTSATSADGSALARLKAWPSSGFSPSDVALTTMSWPEASAYRAGHRSWEKP